MAFSQQVWQETFAPQSDCGALCQPWQEMAQSVWQAIPGGDMPGKVGFISAILGIVAFVTVGDWLWQKLRRDKPEKRAAEDSDRLKRIEDILIGRARAQSASLPGGDQPGAKQAEAIVEQDIGAAISTLAEEGKTEALAAAKRGDTKAADNALAAKIAKIERARLGAAKEEAALYRQRGALAYLHDTDAALRFYAKAAELDPDNGEGLLFLAQLQARAGYHACRKTKLRTPYRPRQPRSGRGITSLGVFFPGRC